MIEKSKVFESKLVFIGMLIAVGISYAMNNTFWWCVLHFILGWVYVAYWFVSQSGIINIGG